MAERKRDYKAEYARRKELARKRGYETYGKQRGKIERGEIPALAPKRIKRVKTKQAQSRWFDFLDGADPKPRSSDAFEEAKKLIPKRDDAGRASEWSAAFARYPIARYRPADAKRLGISKEEYTRAYLAAFVEGEQ